jgi:hypothetical protein
MLSMAQQTRLPEAMHIHAKQALAHGRGPETLLMSLPDRRRSKGVSELLIYSP